MVLQLSALNSPDIDGYRRPSTNNDIWMMTFTR